MADELTATGLSIDSFETRRANVVAALRASISVILDVSPEAPTGQITDILLEHVQKTIELLQEIHASFDPDQATGQSLDGVTSFTGTKRNAADHGTVILSLDLDAAITVPAGNIVAVTGDTDNQWVTTVDVTSVLAGVYPVTAEASETGPIQALAWTITVIVTPVAGWNTVTNAAAAVEGRSIETDVALRVRRELEVTLGGSTSADAVRAAVSQIDGVIEVFCYENDSSVSVAPMPPKSIDVVYWDGGAAAADTAEIAAAIFTEKAGGIRPHGSLYFIHTDNQGNDHLIGMTIAIEQVIVVEVTAITDGDYVAGTIETAVAAYGDEHLGIGYDVYRAEIIAASMAVTGVVNVTQVRLAIGPVPPGVLANVDITIDLRKIATIDVGDVTVV